MIMKTLFSTLSLFLLISCGNSVEFKENFIPNFRGAFPATALNFENISKKIIEPHCLKCHPGYDDYQTIFNQKDSILDAVLSGRMPKNAPALDNNLKGLLSSWVRQGAPLGRGVSQPVPIGLEATWESVSKRIIFPKCVQCHNPEGQASFLDLSTRQKFFEQREDLLNNFQDAQNSYFIEVITDPEEPMPPVWSNIERLKEEEVKVLIEWIEKGLP
jgi:uncharacterized membrane protein